MPIFVILSQTITFNYATADGTASAGSDYVAAIGTVTFNPGEESKTIFVQLKGDTQDEPEETFSLNLSNPVNTSLATPQRQITIINDDYFRLLTEEFSSWAIALDSVTMVRDPFSLTTLFNFSSDHRTQVTLFATNLNLLSGEDASAVLAQAEDAQHRIYPLIVEHVEKVPALARQVTIVLPGEINGVGNVFVSLNLRGTFTYKALVRIKPPGSP